MEKINVAELLKDCPRGMKLDCTMFDDVTLLEVTDSRFPIKIAIGDNRYRYLTKNGGYANYIIPESKCVIFPKGKTTWEGFQRPFKDGDIVFYADTLAIFKEWGDETLFRTYCVFYISTERGISFEIDRPLFGKYIRKEARFATEEEKAKLFQIIKDNGYKWNEETKTLEKLIEPKFKVGNIIQDIDSYKVKITDVNTEDECYEYESMIAKGIGSIAFSEQDEWKFVPNKFDITTLIPFESKVLVRDYDNRMWMPAFWGKRLDGNFNCSYLTTSACYKYCIPYEGNEHLLGTIDDCDDLYKTWEL